MQERELRLQQIRSIANSESIGSKPFFLHICLLGLAALTASIVSNVWAFALLYLVYLTLFLSEKAISNFAHRRRRDALLPIVLAMRFLRASAFISMALLLWTFEGSVYKMGALAMIVTSIINILINQLPFVSAVASVMIPNWLFFGALALLVYTEDGWSVEFLGALVAVICVSPYYFMSFRKVQKRWTELEQTRAELERTQRLEGLGKLAGGVSHDFNNILSVVSGSLQLLENSNSESERKNLLRIALRATEHGSRLTRQMLAHGKRSHLVPIATNLAKALIEFDEFARRILPASIQINIIKSNASPNIFVDPSMLQNALLNLALNAKAAMPAGGKLTFHAETVEAPDQFPLSYQLDGKCARLQISDTGEGIQPEDLVHVCEPFFTTREVGSGSGLGLSMVKGFLEQSNGVVEIESTPGKGTQIILFFPLALSAGEIPEVISEAEVIDTRPLRPGRIMVVEDNPQLLKILELKLRRDGLDVISCHNGDQALEEFAKHSDIALVLSDLVMPGDTQGADLLEHVKAANKALPFIAMSGYADVQSTGEDRLSRADLFLEKPLDLSRLSAEIERFLSLPK